jgi:hypothetical protein
MTETEKILVELLRELAEKYSVIGVKAEFETEGTRLEELRRLKEIAFHSGVSLTLKMGGCTSRRDLFDACALGVDKLVAPMVETAHALGRFLSNAAEFYPDENRSGVRFLINMETITCARNFDKLMAHSYVKNLHGIVVGRTDLTGSMGLKSADAVNCDEVYRITEDVAQKAKQKGLDVIVGGKVTTKSKPFLNSLLQKGLLDRFETRKIVFDAKSALSGDVEKGIQHALAFELAWMKYKRDYYSAIAHEDASRIADLEKRMNA